MRTLCVLVGAGAGAYFLAQSAMKLAVQGVQFAGSGPNPMTAILLPPAILLGAVAGVLLVSFIFPER